MKMKVLFSAEKIAQRVKQIGHEITSFYKNEPLTVVVIMNGSVIFCADLIRAIDITDFYLDSLMVSSYVNDIRSDSINFHSELKLPVFGRHVLLVDDILDSGKTLKRVKEYLAPFGPLSVRSCVLLDKILEPGKEKFMNSDWYGFNVPDLFVIGYGLDSQEKYRNLKDICIVEEDEL